MVFCVGCARNGYWIKPDIETRGYVTEEDRKQFKVDRYICERDSRVSSVHGNEFGVHTTHGVNSRWFYKCMQSKDYEWKKGISPNRLDDKFMR